METEENFGNSMETEEKRPLSSSFLVSSIWFTISIIFSSLLVIFLNIVQYYDGEFFAIIGYIFLTFPFIVAIFVSTYFFLKTKRKYLSLILGGITNIVVLYAFIFFITIFFPNSDFAYYIAIVLFISPIIIIISLILLLFNPRIISQNDFQIKTLTSKITKILSVFYILLLTYFMFNTIIILLATSTGAAPICELTSGGLPVAIQTDSRSYHYPDSCFLEMGKGGDTDICSNIDNERKKNECYLERSLDTGDKTICDKISSMPPIYYMSCIYGEEMVGTKDQEHPVNRCMYPDRMIEDYGKEIPLKECVQTKFNESQLEKDIQN